MHSLTSTWEMHTYCSAHTLQIDTICWMLHEATPLVAERFPDGVVVLSLFDGCGALAVALGRLGWKVKR